MLRSEVDWVKDNAIHSVDEYLTADRRGRGFALNQGQRMQVLHGHPAIPAAPEPAPGLGRCALADVGLHPGGRGAAPGLRRGAGG